MQETLSNEIDRDTHNYKPSTIRSIKNKDKADKSRYYVDKEKFYEEMVKRYHDVKAAEAEGKPKPKISNYIGECILKIANNMAKKYNFSRYSYRDEMVSEAVVHCLSQIDKFDITKSNNPFSYYTQATYFVFIDIIKNEQSELYVKCRSAMDHAAFGDLSVLGDDSDDILEHLHDNFVFNTDFVESFVKTYEDKQNLKKVDKKPKKEIGKSDLDELMEE